MTKHVVSEDGYEDWGYVDVREGVHMFWWLYHTYHEDGMENRPLILWLQVTGEASVVLYIITLNSYDTSVQHLLPRLRHLSISMIRVRGAGGWGHYLYVCICDRLEKKTSQRNEVPTITRHMYYRVNYFHYLIMYNYALQKLVNTAVRNVITNFAQAKPRK